MGQRVPSERKKKWIFECATIVVKSDWWESLGLYCIPVIKQHHDTLRNLHLSLYRDSNTINLEKKQTNKPLIHTESNKINNWHKWWETLNVSSCRLFWLLLSRFSSHESWTDLNTIQSPSNLSGWRNLPPHPWRSLPCTWPWLKWSKWLIRTVPPHWSRVEAINL